MNRRHSCLSDYSRIFADIWPLANGRRPKYSLIVFVTQILQIYTDFLHHDFSSSDFTDESEAFLLVGLLTEFRRTLAAGQWLAPDICFCCFLSHRFHRYTQIFYGISGESLCPIPGGICNDRIGRIREIPCRPMNKIPMKEFRIKIRITKKIIKNDAR